MFVSHQRRTTHGDGQTAKKTDVSKFEKVGAMRAGFETYRAFRRDTADHQAALEKRGKLKLPVLLLAGEASTFVAVSHISFLQSSS